MEKFLIEVPHEGDNASCNQTIQVFLSSGSHFVTHAEWGCTDGDHRAWLIVEVENKNEALRILPAAYRGGAKITRLHKFTREELGMPILDLHT